MMPDQYQNWVNAGFLGELIKRFAGPNSAWEQQMNPWNQAPPNYGNSQDQRENPWYGTGLADLDRILNGGVRNLSAAPQAGAMPSWMQMAAPAAPSAPQVQQSGNRAISMDAYKPGQTYNPANYMSSAGIRNANALAPSGGIGVVQGPGGRHYGSGGLLLR